MIINLKAFRITLGIGVGLLVLMTGIMAAQDIKTNYVPGTDFSKYKTYRWVTVEGRATPDEILDRQIKQAIDAQMIAKGFTKSDNDNVDMYVAYQLTIQREQEWNSYSTGGARWGWGGNVYATSTTIHVGTLGVDFYDPAPKQLIWRGAATKTLNPSNDPQKNQDRLNKAMAKLLKNFPPKPKK